MEELATDELPMLRPGTLRQQAAEVTERALASGALQPIATKCDRVEDQGISFLVRRVDSLARKEQARKQRKQSKPKDFNPFLPYDPELFVADLSPTHLVLLNKFNVVEHHLLIVTRAFEEQESLLTLADFEALAIALRELDGLAFYNGGTVAGASQRHKHLQIVPLPMQPCGDRDARLPVTPIFVNLPSSGQIEQLAFPFIHGAVSLGMMSWAQPDAAVLFELYKKLLELRDGGGAYNLLATRQWMLLVPRRMDECEGISVNSLGFAGSMFVRDEAQLEQLKAIGPMAILRAVAVGS